VTATPTVGAPVVVSGISGLNTTLTLGSGTYTIGVQADVAGMTSSVTTSPVNTVTVSIIAAKPAWAGAVLSSAGPGAVYAWWAASTTPGATYTVTATPTVGTPVVVSGITGLNTTLTLANGTYMIGVQADAPGMTSSAATSPANTVTVSIIAAKPAWAGAVLSAAGPGAVYAWWAASTTPGATYTVTATPTVGAPVVVSGITGLNTTLTLVSGTYTIGVQADAVGMTSSSTTSPGSPVVVP
jgi:hypothetical protein